VPRIGKPEEGLREPEVPASFARGRRRPRAVRGRPPSFRRRLRDRPPVGYDKYGSFSL